MPKLTPEQQKAYDDMRASPGILFDADGNVIFDGEAEAMGATPFKTKAEIKAEEAILDAILDQHGKTPDWTTAEIAAFEAQLRAEAARRPEPMPETPEDKG